jgi:hypothetical protein
MSTLTIKDLAVRKELDRKSMTALRGGMSLRPVKSLYPRFPGYSSQSYSFDFSAQQGISQVQDTLNNNGNNVAFASGIHSTVKPSQSASNNINLGGLLLP